MLNRSVVELKYKGKVYNTMNSIRKILHDNNCSWFLECEVENCIISIEKRTIIFESGIFLGGDFEFGIFKGEFRGGTFINGIFEGVHKGGKIISGIIK